MLEVGRSLPLAGVMAVRAPAIAELIPVGALLPVTTHAVGGEPEERPRECARGGHAGHDGWIPNARGFVAVPTVDGGVTQLELVPGFEMVEPFFIEPPHIEIRPQVILMAFRAGVLGNRRVVPPARGDACAQLLVAVEAALR